MISRVYHRGIGIYSTAAVSEGNLRVPKKKFPCGKWTIDPRDFGGLIPLEK